MVGAIPLRLAEIEQKAQNIIGLGIDERTCALTKFLENVLINFDAMAHFASRLGCKNDSRLAKFRCNESSNCR